MCPLFTFREFQNILSFKIFNSCYKNLINFFLISDNFPVQATVVALYSWTVIVKEKL